MERNNRSKSLVYTDLALEAHSMAKDRVGGEVNGVKVDESQTDNTKITRIEVLNEAGSEALNKPPGLYITIEAPGLRKQNRIVHDEIMQVLANEISHMVNYEQLEASLKKDAETFVVGLGNWHATPDALGPRILNHLMVTRHLYRQAPPELREGMRSVAALAPGVLGLTGVETAEIIKGVVQMIRPDIILAVDALAARSTERLGNTIQLSNAGIFPGSGVGKDRAGINYQTMDIPVIAIGVPTVISGATIVSDALEKLINGNVFSSVERERYRHIGEREKEMVIKSALQPFMGDLIVSPRGVDELIKDVTRIIGGSINVAAHPDITVDNLYLYL